MKGIGSYKIKNKLIAIILSVTILILVIAFTSIIIFERTAGMNALLNQITTAAEITANNLLGALDFATDEEITDHISPLNKIPAIQSYYVYDKMDEEKVQSNPGKIKPLPIKKFGIEKTSVEITGRLIHVVQPVIFKGEYYGTLYVIASTEELDKQINSLIYFIIPLVLVLILLSVFLANKLQGIISKPVLSLVDVSRKVSSEGDYALRVEKKNSDEIGMLYDAFNEMMDQVLRRNMERDLVESELKNAQFFLSSVIQSMPSLLIVIEQNGKITQWNDSTTKIIGIGAGEAVGNNLWEILPDFIEFKESIPRLAGEEKSLEFYKKLIKIKGEPFYFNGSIYPLMEAGKPGNSKYVLLLNNVTEIEIKERQLRQSQKMETVGNLAGGLAHDFNNVLGGIIGTISLFKYKIAKNKEITQIDTEKYFNIIEEASNRASDMVQHLLSLTRKQELSFTPIDLNTTIKSIVKICSNTFDKSIEIETDYYKGRAMTKADPTQIEQSLLNLCINASHAMTIMRKESDRYGGTLNISLKKVMVDKYFRRLHEEAGEPDYWDISVSDTGVGMDQKLAAKIFDPFFTTKSEGTGTGLGLSMVYNIIKQHKGFIDVYAREEIGATFHIYLPILKGEFIEEELKEPEEIPQGEGLVLVVDDEEVMRQTAKSILMECGYHVILAENGEQAVKIFKKHKKEIKAVLLDMVMPKMSGRQTYLELVKIKKKVKVLLVSGFKQDHRVDSILKLGVKGFIQKPYTLAALANRMHYIMNKD